MNDAAPIPANSLEQAVPLPWRLKLYLAVVLAGLTISLLLISLTWRTHPRWLPIPLVLFPLIPMGCILWSGEPMPAAENSESAALYTRVKRLAWMVYAVTIAALIPILLLDFGAAPASWSASALREAKDMSWMAYSYTFAARIAVDLHLRSLRPQSSGGRLSNNLLAGPAKTLSSAQWGAR